MEIVILHFSQDVIQLAKMAIIRDQVEFFHVLEDVCGVTSDNLGENFDRELSSKMVWREDHLYTYHCFVWLELQPRVVSWIYSTRFRLWSWRNVSTGSVVSNEKWTKYWFECFRWANPVNIQKTKFMQLMSSYFYGRSFLIIIIYHYISGNVWM